MSKPPPRKENGQNRQGRPRLYATHLPVYDSMDQCSAACGIPISALRYAKKHGCLFIRHGRVHLDEFLKWFFAQTHKDEDEMLVDWAKRDRRAAALLKECKLEEDRERVVDFSNVTRIIQQLVRVEFFGELERLANEYPTSLTGKTPVQINEECIKQGEKIKKTLESALDTWEKTKGKL